MAEQRNRCGFIKRGALFASAFVTSLTLTSPAHAISSADGTLVSHGFIDYTQHNREGYGMVKNRIRGQLETTKDFGNVGIFRAVSLNNIIRITHDGVYEWNNDDFGDEAGGSVFGTSTGEPNGSALGEAEGVGRFAGKLGESFAASWRG
tara:strand:- start:23 stop:469 length:447 start_codon:yes stop_codon:yes gene_type:complete